MTRIRQALLDAIKFGAINPKATARQIDDFSREGSWAELRKDRERLICALSDCLHAMSLRQESNADTYDAAVVQANAVLNDLEVSE